MYTLAIADCAGKREDKAKRREGGYTEKITSQAAVNLNNAWRNQPSADNKQGTKE